MCHREKKNECMSLCFIICLSLYLCPLRTLTPNIQQIMNRLTLPERKGCFPCILLLLVFLLMQTTVSAQNTTETENGPYKEKTLKTESDGFQWYLVTDEYRCKGALDVNGKVLIPFSGWYKDVHYADGFLYARGEWASSATYACYDKDGRMLISKGKYNRIHFINSEKYFWVERNGKEGACDMTGKEIVAPQYSGIGYDKAKGFFYLHQSNNWVYLNIFLPGDEKTITAPKRSAEINKVWLEQDTEINGHKSLKVYCDLTIEGMNNQLANMEVWIKNSKGKWHKFFGNATSPEGVSYKRQEFVPPYESTYYSELWTVIYNEDLKPGSGTRQYQAIVRITDNDGHVLAENPPVAFTEKTKSETRYRTTPYIPSQNITYNAKRVSPNSTQRNGKSTVNNTVQTSSRSGKQTNTNENLAKHAHERTKKNLDYQHSLTYKRTYDDYEDKLIDMSKGRRQYDDRKRRDYQDSMRRIRQRCEAQGVWIWNTSKWENWNGK